MSQTVKQSTLHQSVYLRIKQSILDGDFVPGRPVTIRGLASDLEVSPMPVREALKRLTSERALQISDTGRVSVPTMTNKKLEELVRARICLEKQAAIDALPHVTPNLIARLKKTDQRVNRMIRKGDHKGYLISHRKFHFDLYKAGSGTVFLPLIESIWLQVSPFLSYTLEHLDAYDSNDRHVEIIHALESKDGTALGFAVEADIRQGLGSLADSDW